MNFSTATAILFAFLCLPSMRGQAPSSPEKASPEKTPQEKVKLDADDPAAKNEDKRVMGVLPNYRTAELTPDYHPVSAKYKMTIALKDTFDYPLMGIGAIYAGIYQLEDSHPQFGQGVKGYLRRFGTSYNDQLMGNMMTEGVLPVLFKEDPRYFRMNEGPIKKRLFYSISRIFITRTDTGAHSFNFAEVLGNSAAAAVGLSYYTDDRSPGEYLENVSIQLGTDAFSQVLKEFWPDIKRHYLHHHSAADAPLAAQKTTLHQ